MSDPTNPTWSEGASGTERPEHVLTNPAEKNDDARGSEKPVADVKPAEPVKEVEAPAEAKPEVHPDAPVGEPVVPKEPEQVSPPKVDEAPKPAPVPAVPEDKLPVVCEPVKTVEAPKPVEPVVATQTAGVSGGKILAGVLILAGVVYAVAKFQGLV